MSATETLPTQDKLGEEKQEWTYIGQRLDNTGVLSHVWLDQEGIQRLFAKPLATMPAIGSVYVMTVSSDGRSVYTTGSKAPVFVTHKDDASKVARWHADNALALTKASSVRKEKKLLADHKGDLGNMTLAEAASWYRASRTVKDKASKLAVLVNYLQVGFVINDES